MTGPLLWWLRRDLRLTDQPALAAAERDGRPVIPVYVHAAAAGAKAGAHWGTPGAASRWWLHQSLAALGADLEARGSRLVIRCGDPAAVLPALAAASDAGAVCWNQAYEPSAREEEAQVGRALRAAGIQASVQQTGLLFEPDAIASRGGAPYRVFTPFWRACVERGVHRTPQAAPKRLPPPAAWPPTDSLESVGLEPRPDWAGGLRATWTPGEAGAAVRLDLFAERLVAGYAEGRDLVAQELTSRLSPHLHFGEITPLQVWERLAGRPGAVSFLRQLGWREFGHHVLWHQPHTADLPLQPRYADFPWADDRAGLDAWQRGQTGYPLVDAGMRQLWATGWMHNRARMAVASFLVKHLLVRWQEGTRWFWDTLVDADLANNTLGWQWSAGCGADAAPYFRIFSPVLQGERFDPEGEYVRRWVPELARLAARFVHRPWEAPAGVLAQAGVRLDGNYPGPIVDHTFARQRALTALARIRR